jgi:hypothetical protein
MKLLVSASFFESCVADKVGLLNDESWFMQSSDARVEERGIFRDCPLMEVVMPRWCCALPSVLREGYR